MTSFDAGPGGPVPLADMCDATYPAAAIAPGVPAPARLLQSPAGGIWIACTRRATARYRYACVHEHIQDRQTCDVHAPEPGSTGCQQCWDLGHDCPMAFERIEEES